MTDSSALPLSATYGPTFLADPYATFAAARTTGAVHPDSTGSGWFVVGDDELRAVLRDPTHAKDPAKAADHPFTRVLIDKRSLLFMDGPDHARLRRFIATALTPGAVARMEPGIQRLVDDLLDAVDPRGEWDLIASLAAPLPLLVVIDLLGLDRRDLEALKAWADDNVRGLDPLQSADERARVDGATECLDSHLRAAVAARRSRPGDDIIGTLISAQATDGREVSDDDIAALLGILVVAGTVTTTDLIGNAMLALLEQADQWRLLCERPDLVDATVEEALRFDAPAQLTSRIATRDQTIGGCPIRAGDWIWAALAAGNRDPAAHADPNRFDIRRRDTHHVSFGAGSHFCPGASLARLEARIAFSTLARRFPRLSLADPEEGPAWKSVWSFRGLERLLVVDAERDAQPATRNGRTVTSAPSGC